MKSGIAPQTLATTAAATIESKRSSRHIKASPSDTRAPQPAATASTYPNVLIKKYLEEYSADAKSTVQSDKVYYEHLLDSVIKTLSPSMNDKERFALTNYCLVNFKPNYKSYESDPELYEYDWRISTAQEDDIISHPGVIDDFINKVQHQIVRLDSDKYAINDAIPGLEMTKPSFLVKLNEQIGEIRVFILKLNRMTYDHLKSFHSSSILSEDAKKQNLNEEAQLLIQMLVIECTTSVVINPGDCQTWTAMLAADPKSFLVILKEIWFRLVEHLPPCPSQKIRTLQSEEFSRILSQSCEIIHRTHIARMKVLNPERRPTIIAFIKRCLEEYSAEAKSTTRFDMLYYEQLLDSAIKTSFPAIKDKERFALTKYCLANFEPKYKLDEYDCSISVHQQDDIINHPSVLDDFIDSARVQIGYINSHRYEIKDAMPELEMTGGSCIKKLYELIDEIRFFILEQNRREYTRFANSLSKTHESLSLTPPSASLFEDAKHQHLREKSQLLTQMLVKECTTHSVIAPGDGPLWARMLDEKPNSFPLILKEIWLRMMEQPVKQPGQKIKISRSEEFKCILFKAREIIHKEQIARLQKAIPDSEKPLSELIKMYLGEYSADAKSSVQSDKVYYEHLLDSLIKTISPSMSDKERFALTKHCLASFKPNYGFTRYGWRIAVTQKDDIIDYPNVVDDFINNVDNQLNILSCHRHAINDAIPGLEITDDSFINKLSERIGNIRAFILEESHREYQTLADSLSEKKESLTLTSSYATWFSDVDYSNVARDLQPLIQMLANKCPNTSKLNRIHDGQLWGKMLSKGPKSFPLILKEIWFRVSIEKHSLSKFNEILHDAREIINKNQITRLMSHYPEPTMRHVPAQVYRDEKRYGFGGGSSEKAKSHLASGHDAAFSGRPLSHQPARNYRSKT